ncbi:MAG: hypothetical protein HY927_01575 [Elusimicrobia bacterium]|nr:hypothetical protein [Elusimicrobiota bacterium]
MRRAVAAFAGVLVLLAVGPAGADKGQWSLSLTPGIAVPVGTNGTFVDQHGNSLNILACVNYEVADGYWYAMEMGFSGGHKFQGTFEGMDLDRDGSPETVSFTSDMDTTMLHFSPTLKVGGSLTDEVRYYFGVGGGVYAFIRGAGNAILSGQTTNGTSLAGQTLPMKESSNTYFGLSAGHTLGYGITDTFELDLDFRYHAVFMPGGGAGIVVPGLRFAYQF